MYKTKAFKLYTINEVIVRVNQSSRVMVFEKYHVLRYVSIRIALYQVETLQLMLRHYNNEEELKLYGVRHEPKIRSQA